jgi:hypothetical protein
MTTAEAVKHLREISCETDEMRAKIADLLEAKDAECKAWRAYQDFIEQGACDSVESANHHDQIGVACRRCDELEGK